MPPEKEAVEKVVARGEFPILHYEEGEKLLSPCICYRSQDSSRTGSLRLNSYYAVVEDDLRGAIEVLNNFVSIAGKELKVWLCPTIAGFMIRVLSVSPSSEELVKILPLLRKLETEGKAKIVRPLGELDSYPDNRGCADVHGKGMIILGSKIISGILEKIGPSDLASILLSSWKPRSYDDIIRLIEDTGLLRIRRVLTVKVNGKPVGATIRAQPTVGEIPYTVLARLLGELTSHYIMEKYGITLDYKTSVLEGREIEVFVFRKGFM